MNQSLAGLTETIWKARAAACAAAICPLACSLSYCLVWASMYNQM